VRNGAAKCPSVVFLFFLKKEISDFTSFKFASKSFRTRCTTQDKEEEEEEEEEWEEVTT
jgi:hypothetical protein